MQLPKLSLILLSNFSILFMGCPDGPAIKVCLSSPKTDEFRCYDSQSSATSAIDFANTENYVCVSPQDEKILLDYCKQKP